MPDVASRLPASPQIITRPISGLTPDPQSPRQHGKRKIGQLMKSMKRFGFIMPVLVDRAGKIIAGHARVLACQRLGWTEVPVLCLDHLSPAEAKAYMIADNRLAELATWDDRLLGELFRDIFALEVDFNLELTGFDMAEIDLRIAGLEIEPGPADAADTLPPAMASAASRPGDLWLLDRHRVLCGSATEADAYVTLLNGEQAGMVFTDPPYNVRIGGHVSGLGKVCHREFAEASGEMSEAEFTGFLAGAFQLLAGHSRDGAVHYVCCDWRHLNEFLGAGRQAYGALLNLCVWTKDNGGMGSLYRSQHELVLVFRHGRTQHRNNVQLGRYGRNRTNVWNFPGIATLARRSEEGNLLALHPTVKPVAMVAEAILDVSARGDIVLDPFLGSGTTVISTERTGRRCYGMEIDPLYVDTVVRRWQAYTGGTARHAVTGQTFDEAAGAVRRRWRPAMPRRLREAPERDYEVGRGKPPVESRFKPGQSGNPHGRPKGSQSLNTMIENELDQRVTIKENGRAVTVTKRQLVAKQAVNKAAAGDSRQLILLAKFANANPAASADDAGDTILDSEDDKLVMLNWLRRSNRGESS